MKVSSPITSINNAIAVDPVEYVGIPFSFHYFQPDRDIVNYNWMPGKPSSPFGPIFGLYFHFIHPFIVVCARRTVEPPDVGERRDQIMSWISVVPSS